MPSIVASTAVEVPTDSMLERLAELGPEGRHRAYKRGQLNDRELTQWAAHYPLEIPKVNDEIAWIAFTLADLD